jgi:acyl-CoA thioester hydrolase
MYVHETKVRVLYAHTDKGGVVYYAKYLEFFEAGRAEYFRSLRTRVTQIRRTRVDFEYEVAGPTGAVLCRGTTVLACISASTRRPCELPEEMRAMLEKHLNL